ncbi:MAG: 30S ribosomal protein S16, partial [Victivallaceae bacterium]|nr:30S ribosomal protein S16 [Victivallaceae bacterium]
MSVKIRLKRTGTRNNHCFRIVVMDVRCSRDGKAIEEIGLYDPRHKNENIDMERYAYWRQVGAQPSETVELIVKRAEEGRKLGEKAK